MRLAGRRALITGCSSGLGAALARGFWAEGASLALASRRADPLEALRSALAPAPEQKVIAIPCDVSDPAARAAMWESIADRLGGLEILVNNAAIQGPIGPFAENDPAAWRRTIETNLIAPVELCGEFLRRRSRGALRAKIINLSGGGATSSRPWFSSYATAKTGLVRFTEVLADELSDADVDVNAVAPGAMATGMTAAILAAGDLAGSREWRQAQELGTRGDETISRAVALCIFLASAESDGITGRLISALWDPWQALPAHRSDLIGSDIYTLRRVVPKDRGKAWPAS